MLPNFTMVQPVLFGQGSHMRCNALFQLGILRPLLRSILLTRATTLPPVAPVAIPLSSSPGITYLYQPTELKPWKSRLFVARILEEFPHMPIQKFGSFRMKGSKYETNFFSFESEPFFNGKKKTLLLKYEVNPKNPHERINDFVWQKTTFPSRVTSW